MRIAICDDESKICEMLNSKVKKIFPDAEIITYTSGKELLNDNSFPDILLLDIRMPDISGMDVASELRSRNFRNIIIFITGEEDEVFNSFDVQPFHFLVKPVLDDKLKTVLENAAKELSNRKNNPSDNHEFINIQSGTSHIRVNLSMLIYAEVYDRKTILHMKKENIEYYGQLSALEKLVGEDFFRIHRSYLVNMRYVQRYDRTTVRMINGDKLSLSRRLYDDFLKAYMDYSRRGMDK